MPIWILIPTRKTSDYWTQSSYKGDVVVRAPNEEEARNLAEARFGISEKQNSLGETPISPWKCPELARCIRLKTTRYEDSGPNEVIVPRKARGRLYELMQQVREKK